MFGLTNSCLWGIYRHADSESTLLLLLLQGVFFRICYGALWFSQNTKTFWIKICSQIFLRNFPCHELCITQIRYKNTACHSRSAGRMLASIQKGNNNSFSVKVDSIQLVFYYIDRKSTRLNSSHPSRSRMPSSA